VLRLVAVSEQAKHPFTERMRLLAEFVDLLRFEHYQLLVVSSLAVFEKAVVGPTPASVEPTGANKTAVERRPDP
jgi:hypothetical protein